MRKLEPPFLSVWMFCPEKVEGYMETKDGEEEYQGGQGKEGIKMCVMGGCRRWRWLDLRPLWTLRQGR